MNLDNHHHTHRKRCTSDAVKPYFHTGVIIWQHLLIHAKRESRFLSTAEGVFP